MELNKKSLKTHTNKLKVNQKQPIKESKNILFKKLDRKYLKMYKY